MASRGRTTIKKTLVLQPTTDEFVRRTWAMLIDQGYDASYSTAVNFILLAAIKEGSKAEGFSTETIDTLRQFLSDQNVLKRLNLDEELANLKKFWRMDR